MSRRQYLLSTNHRSPPFSPSNAMKFSYIAGIPVGVGAFSMICFQGNELSSPFLHLRWFYNAARKDDTLVYRATTAIFIVIFFFHRVLYNSFVIYVTFVQTFAEWDLLLGVVSGLPLSVAVLEYGLGRGGKGGGV